MNSRLRGWFDLCRLSPRALRRMHGWLTVMWAAMIPVSVFTGLRNSVPYLVALSARLRTVRRPFQFLAGKQKRN